MLLHVVSFNVTTIETEKKKKIKGENDLGRLAGAIPASVVPCLFLIEKVWFDMAAGDTDLCHSTN